jgi:hypothetical protein
VATVYGAVAIAWPACLHARCGYLIQSRWLDSRRWMKHCEFRACKGPRKLYWRGRWRDLCRSRWESSCCAKKRCWCLYGVSVRSNGRGWCCNGDALILEHTRLWFDADPHLRFVLHQPRASSLWTVFPDSAMMWILCSSHRRRSEHRSVKTRVRGLRKLWLSSEAGV